MIPSVTGSARASLSRCPARTRAGPVVPRERRDYLGDDLIGLLLGMETDGRALETGAILSHRYGLTLGADVTAPFVPTGAPAAAIGTPVRDDWRSSPEQLNTGVDEALRWASPANHFMRYALHGIEIRGNKVRAGDAVVVRLGSADRDADILDRPLGFGVHRKPNRHMAFGGGAHYRVGRTAARMSLKVPLAELFTNFGAFEFGGEPQHLHSDFVAGVKSGPPVAAVRAGPEPACAGVAE